MRKFIFATDKLIEAVAKAFAWCVAALAFGLAYDLVVVALFGEPTRWTADLSYMVYGTLFMMGGAYALSRDRHARADVLYRLWQPRTQGIVQLVLYITLFVPAAIALIFAGWTFAQQSIAYREVSVMSPANMPIFQFKMIIPAAGLLLLLQGVAQVARCIIAVRENK
ncbi:MAG: TRAP transporter small permease subunit, partial [Hyphomicrobiaceae bacterium]